MKILVRKSFPKATIQNVSEFSAGLVSPTFKVRIKNPTMFLVVKLSKMKNKNEILTNNKILEYLNKNQLPAPKIFFSGVYDRKVITIMELTKGKLASEVFEKSSLQKKRIILKNAGKTLKKIHDLKTPSFWIHQNHEIKNEKQWKEWIRLRKKKYLSFLKKKIPNYYKLLENKLERFQKTLDKGEKINLVPLHWDFHFNNLNVDKKGKIVGIFDFDNAMKGHYLAEIGQTAYWLRFHFKTDKYLKYFLQGYKKSFTKKEMNLIRGYELLHLLAVSRTIWFRQKRLGWIIDDHKKILDELLK